MLETTIALLNFLICHTKLWLKFGRTFFADHLQYALVKKGRTLCKILKASLIIYLASNASRIKIHLVELLQKGELSYSNSSNNRISAHKSVINQRRMNDMQ